MLAVTFSAVSVAVFRGFIWIWLPLGAAYFVLILATLRRRQRMRRTSTIAVAAISVFLLSDYVVHLTSRWVMDRLPQVESAAEAGWLVSIPAFISLAADVVGHGLLTWAVIDGRPVRQTVEEETRDVWPAFAFFGIVLLVASLCLIPIGRWRFLSPMLLTFAVVTAVVGRRWREHSTAVIYALMAMATRITAEAVILFFVATDPSNILRAVALGLWFMAIFCERDPPN
jgi:hypothetical protein